MSFYRHFLVFKVPVYFQVREADGWSYGRTKLAVQLSLDFHDRGETAKIKALTRIGTKAPMEAFASNKLEAASSC